ncbi:hypothetical protein [Luteimonas deserti]|uniref:hypothetical protein n=1 Tax=Luteimonas deserti TaxID=2752306 RepID=UPI001F2922D4|nr:hypothetical protein [Luteimonas deserti]
MSMQDEKQARPVADSDQTEADRQQDVSVWARAFGVSSDAPATTPEAETPEAREADAQAERTGRTPRA